MTRILVLEQISPAGIDALRAVSEFEVVELYEDDPSKIGPELARAEALIVRSKTKVTGELLLQANCLKVIGRPGTGVDNIDVASATARGIVVMNTPAGNSISAAEHTVGLMLALLRKIAQADASLKQGKWSRQQFMGTELHEKIVGIIGYGKIGTEVVKRVQSFNARVLVCDPFVSDAIARDHNFTLAKLDDLLRQADVISLHTPLTPTTRRMIDSKAFEMMKPGAFLVNVARGELVDEPALLSALQSGKLAGAALDVFSSEPKPNLDLVHMPNVVATPHIGASTVEAQEKVGYDIALQIRDFFVDGIARNAVNFPSISLSEHRKIVPYLQLGEKLGSLCSQLSRGRMEEVAVRYYGDLVQVNTHLIGAAVVMGILRPILTGRISLVNALETARERGIHFVESTSSRQRSYSNLISVRLLTNQGEEWVEGTVLHQDHLHIVSIHGIDVDAPLAGDMLILHNEDAPGVIGHVGTLLGDNAINIANFALGRREAPREAVGVVNVDSEICERVLGEIRALPHVLRAEVVHEG